MADDPNGHVDHGVSSTRHHTVDNCRISRVHAKALLRRVLRRRGIELRAFKPDIYLDAHLWWLFRELEINCVLDVGAHFGEYGDWLRNNDYKGFIVSFEPVEESFHVLRQRCAGDRRRRAIHLALGSTNGSAQINVAAGSDLTSFRQLSEFGTTTYTSGVVTRQETVQVRRLDQIFEAVTAHVPNPRVYLKMDTQGWDLEVLRGAQGCLNRILALQSEMAVQHLYTNSPDFREAISEFERSGFSISGLFSVGHDAQGRMVEFDCVMRRI